MKTSQASGEQSAAEEKRGEWSKSASLCAPIAKKKVLLANLLKDFLVKYIQVKLVVGIGDKISG